MSDPVLVRMSGGIAEIRFNRPDRLNALDVELAEGFAAAVSAVTANSTVKVIVVSAEGRGFRCRRRPGAFPPCG